MKSKIRIVLADDHELFRFGFKALLDNEIENVEVVAHAADGKELLKFVETYAPDLVITDIQMPVMDGIEACRQLQQTSPQIPVIALSIYNDEHYIVDMLEAGAKGYLLKNATRQEVKEAIDTVYEGGKYLSKDMSLNLATLLAKSRADLFRQQEQPKFSNKEKQIIQLICQEYASKEIADQLHLTHRTVEFYRKEIQKKIGARNMAGVIVYALRNGLFN
jgi:DNA-binding NarL/FixJ family response regulator